MVRIRLMALLLCSVLIVSSYPVRAQNADPNTVARKAVEFLKSKLPKPTPVIEGYTYTSETFPDTGLGCPAPGQTYAQAATPGYKFLISAGGILYEVHTNLDGSSAMLCDSANVKQTANLSVFRTPLFSIPYPEKWSATPRDGGEVFFGPGLQQICAQPGLIVTPLGAQPPGKTTDALLDDYLSANRGQAAIGNRVTVGQIGRSLTVQGPCTDGTVRSFRVSMFLAFGQGYRVILYAPKAAFDQWSDLFQKITEGFSPSATGSGSGESVIQPSGAPDTLLVHLFNGNLYAAAVDDLLGTPLTRDGDLITGSRVYGNARIAPDGKRVAFTDAARKALFVVGVEKDPAPRQLATDVAAGGYPVAWSPDGQEIAYIAEATPPAIKAVRVADGSSRTLGMPPIRLCPDAKSPDPAEAALRTDRGSDLLLEWVVPDTLLLSRDCDDLGVGQLDIKSGNFKLIPQVIARSRLSPSRTRLAGMALGKLNVFDLPSGTNTLYDILADRVAWSADGAALLYTTRTPKAPLKLDRAVGELAPFDSIDAELTLHRFDPLSKQDTLLFQGEGYAIGSVATDANGVLFTVIQTDAALIEGLSRNASGVEVRRLLPGTLLYWLPNGSPAPTLIARTAQPEFGPPGSAAVIGLPVRGQKRPGTPVPPR